MKKNLLLAILVLAVCLLSGCGPTESKPEEFTIEDGVVTGYKGNASEIVIPDGVTAIGKEAFKGKDINSVSIPDSCTLIGSRAFYGCKKLTRVVLPDNGIYLGAECFFNCTAIKEINIPESADFSHTPFSYTADFHSIVPSPGWFLIPTSPVPTNSIHLRSMHKTDTGLLRLTFIQASGNKIPVTFTADGIVQISQKAGFTVTLNMPDGSTLSPAGSELTLDMENRQYVFTFDFDTEVRPAQIVCDSAQKTVVLNGASWDEYQSWESH
ncbi:MAG: leucine-rich repeat domain-containing protein [Clostridia bacterium]|nr:leucine-rich repeat domain-containing protein [Clostridia bacterium]